MICKIVSQAPHCSKVPIIKPLIFFQTAVGTFYIVETEDRLFHPVFEGRGLGAYIELKNAVKDLAMNATHSVRHPKTGRLLDTSKLGIPDSPELWTRMERKPIAAPAAKQ